MCRDSCAASRSGRFYNSALGLVTPNYLLSFCDPTRWQVPPLTTSLTTHASTCAITFNAPRYAIVKSWGHERADRRKHNVPACIPRRRVRRGKLFADIIQDRRTDPLIAHCVVQRQGSPEILQLQQFCSRSAAERAAKQFMSDYERRLKSSRRAA